MIPRTLFASLALPAFLLLGTGGAFAQDADTSGDTRYFVGLGAGFETGNGLQLGIGRGKDALQLGLGLLYDDADARTDYSIGLRYLRTLYSGRVNDTYAWTGFATHGSSRKESGSNVSGVGAGLGVSLHYGLPFHVNLDSGFQTMFGSGSDYEVNIWPTLNVAVVYVW